MTTILNLPLQQANPEIIKDLQEKFPNANLRIEVNKKTVLKDPVLMPKDLTFESLLHLASDAYFKKTGKEFEYFSTIPIETYSNKAGWAESA